MTERAATPLFAAEGVELLPAALGGRPIRPQGPPPWPIPDEEVREALLAAYADGTWGKYQGGLVERLQEELAAYHDVSHVLTCGSGTFAIELALRALKIGPGDEVILAAYEYPGNFLSIHAVGAIPVLVDVHPDNWNLDPERIEQAVGPATRAILVSHLHGGIVPMSAVMAIASSHGLRVIEDAAQAPGSVVEGRRAGTWGDVGTLSFGGSKLLTAGRGGALLTRHADVHQRARTHQSRGNLVCPLSELQAAVLIPQLAKLDERNARRFENVARLAAGLRGVTGLRPFQNHVTKSQPGYYKLGLQFDARAFGLSRDRFATALRAEGIACDEGFRALHVGRSPARFRQAGDLHEAKRAHEGTVIVHHPVLLEASITDATHAIRKLQHHAARFPV